MLKSRNNFCGDRKWKGLGKVRANDVSLFDRGSQEAQKKNSIDFILDHWIEGTRRLLQHTKFAPFFGFINFYWKLTMSGVFSNGLFT